jgi:hypothetical protein
MNYPHHHYVQQIPPKLPDTPLPKVPTHMSNSIDVNTAPASKLVPFYSEVYQYWAAQVAACKNSGDESSSNYQWAAYYADLSSRAAHHYNSILKQELEAARSMSLQSTQFVQSSPSVMVTQPATTVNTNTVGPPPESFKQYAHRCMAQCTTETQNKAMKALIELKIKKSLQDGSMHVRNWNVEPLLPLYISKQDGKTYANVVSSNTSTAQSNAQGKTVTKTVPEQQSLVTTIKKEKKRKLGDVKHESSSLPENASYYGPTTSAHSTTATTSPSAKKTKVKVSLPNDDFVSFSHSIVQKSHKLTKSEKKKLKLEKKENHGFEAGQSKLAERANRFSGKGGITHATSEGLHSVYKEGMDRFMGKGLIGGVKTKLDETDYEKMTVKGTCKILEKDFFRLTAPPKAELVRPQPILEKHLKNIQKMWKARKEKGGINRDYNWFCSQLKAIRQDLVVQRIFNDFAIKAYETHARFALQEGDLNEYNQSQTQLKDLYEKLRGENVHIKNENEFIAYRIIYHVFLTGNKKYQGGSTDILKIMLTLTPEQRLDPAISHALKVRAAVADNDYHAFFKLQDICPNLGAYLMDAIIPQMRASAMKCMMQAYRPTLSVDFILNEIGFTLNGILEKEEGLAWLKGCGCKFSVDQEHVMTKESCELNEAYLTGNRTSSLI